VTILQIMADDDARVLHRTTDPEEIRSKLEPLGIWFERWEAAVPLDDAADGEQVLEAYQDDVERLCKQGDYRLVDVVRMHPDDEDPEWPEKARTARGKFLDEHTHDEDEVRFFVEGSGCFYLHLGDQVYAVVCEAGDLLAVPEGTTHWFDMGERPRFAAIRFFQDEDGWVGNFTGSDISSRIPSLDELVAA
jgi:1,2-dihydroxy-3-keto-5-methylthiopentene dioxygenase